MLSIPTTDKDYAIIRNINDTLLWYRVSDGIWKIINAARAEQEQDFEADTYYHGLSVSFHLLGINYNDELCSELDKMFWKHKDDETSSMDTAKVIYSEWIAYLKEYSLSNLKPVA